MVHAAALKIIPGGKPGNHAEPAFSGETLIVLFTARHLIRAGKFVPCMALPFPFECHQCRMKGFHVLTHADISEGIKLRFTCVGRCQESFTIIDDTRVLPPLIHKSIRRFGSIEPLMKSLSKTNLMWDHFANLRFSSYPSGYMLPQHVFAYGSATMESGPTLGNDHKVEIMFRRFLEPYPHINWLKESLFLSLANTDPHRSMDLESLQWFSDQGLFLLPEGSCGPGDRKILFVGFCILDEGIHWRGNSSSIYACFERRLLLWTYFPDEGLNFLADIPLMGKWGDIKCPSGYLSDDRALFHFLVNLVLSANMVMTRHPQWCASDPVQRGLSTKQRRRRKKERRNGQSGDEGLPIRYKIIEGFSYGYQPRPGVQRYHYQPRKLDIPEMDRVHDYHEHESTGKSLAFPPCVVKGYYQPYHVGGELVPYWRIPLLRNDPRQYREYFNMLGQNEVCTRPGLLHDARIRGMPELDRERFSLALSWLETHFFSGNKNPTGKTWRDALDGVQTKFWKLLSDRVASVGCSSGKA